MFLKIKHMVNFIFVKCEAQATVEAAVMIPVIFLCMLLLIQPGIILYDKIVMNEACAEACRVLATANSSDKESLVEPYIRRRLGAIPQQDNFHVHSSGCTYEVETNGDQTTQTVSTTIKNQVKPLPLIGFLSSLVGILNSNNNFEISATSTQELRPDWISSSPQGVDANKWVGEWLK